MKTVSLSGSLRENVGKKDAKKNRREGKVPCVLYGGKEQIHLQMDEKVFTKIVFTPDVYILKISIDGKEHDAILQDIQYHPVTDVILHADFLEINLGNPISIGVPIKLTGSSIGVLRGGKLIQKLRRIRVKGLIEDLPEFLEIDITDIDIGDSTKIRDLELDQLELLDPANSVIVRVRTARVIEEQVEEEEEGEEGAEATVEGGEAPAEGGEGKKEAGEEKKDSDKK
ncbi:MAG: 50S ribosomal protein L25/general stress protein Ctc [Bacteroidales bacterium]|nr:50S ribosomal protein L25/general stress protein Ctc [Bacteroidales bacterium]